MAGGMLMLGGGGAGRCLARILSNVEPVLLELPLLTTLSTPLLKVAGGGDRGRARELLEVADVTDPPTVEGVKRTCFLTLDFFVGWPDLRMAEAREVAAVAAFDAAWDRREDDGGSSCADVGGGGAGRCASGGGGMECLCDEEDDDGGALTTASLRGDDDDVLSTPHASQTR